ncbi:hypothetical protein [Nonomuraea africana]|uniref:hypothetical protein n=1 Tax=Nonomuraea africana TaxID=46171 RepID=UPI0033D14B54
MVTREEMVQAFGDEGLLLMDVEQAREKGLSNEDTRILSQVGLPVRADQVFTTFLTDDPRAGSLAVFQTGSGEVDVDLIAEVLADTRLEVSAPENEGIAFLLRPSSKDISGPLRCPAAAPCPKALGFKQSPGRNDGFAGPKVPPPGGRPSGARAT